MVFPFEGRTPPRALVTRIRRGEAAGVLFLGSNVGTPAQVRALTRRLRSIPRPRAVAPPLLLMVDQEGGSVQRLPGAPTLSAPAMGATGDPAVARAQGRATAATLRGAGMNVDLAPVVDVVRQGSALQAEGRGFGATTAVASRFGAAFTRGLVAGHVAATAKHFPGFGAATANTDNGAVTIGLSRHVLAAVHRPPFAAAIGAGARLVMVASAVYPALSPLPAVLSRSVVGGDLRGKLRFGGVTITDDLQAPLFGAFGGTSPRRSVPPARAWTCCCSRAASPAPTTPPARSRGRCAAAAWIAARCSAPRRACWRCAPRCAEPVPSAPALPDTFCHRAAPCWRCSTSMAPCC